MAKTMTASQMTDGQIDNVCAKLRDALRKHREEISSKAAQAALGVDNIGMMMFAPFREQADKFTEMIIREVEVDYDIPPEEAIHATKRAEYLNGEVVATMPRNGKGKKRVKVCFFPLRDYKSVDEVDAMLAERGLKPDPYALAQVNKEDPAFADERPNGTQWKDERGRHCYVNFRRWHGKRRVDCDRDGHDWHDRWWIGGVPASG